MTRSLPLLALLALACGGKPAEDAPSDDTGGAPGDDTGTDSGTDSGNDSAGPPPGDAVLLYNGQGGGAYDIYEDDLVALYDALGVRADVRDAMPSAIADDYGLLIVLSPTNGFPDAAPAAELLARGGTVVVSLEHGGYGDWEAGAAWLAELGSTLEPLGGSTGGTDELSVTGAGGVTDGVSALHIFYYGDLDVGDGLALGTRSDGEPGIGYEEVGAGRVLLVPDGSFFGYSLDEADNRRLLENLAP